MNEKPDLIQPTAFEPATARPQDEANRQAPWPRYLLMALAALLLLALFSAKSLSINGVPPEAETELSGGLSIALGKRYLLWNGDYHLRVSAPGFYTAEQAVDIAGEDLALQLELQRLPDKLILVGDIAAQVNVNGEAAGTIPVTLELVPGEHNLQFVAENYRPLQQTVSIAGGGNEITLSPEMEPAWADVTVQSTPQGAAIMLGDKALGQTPATVAVPEGEQQLLLVLAGYKNEALELIAEAGVAQTLPAVALSEADASLELKSVPAAAAVMLDGAYQGQTPLTLALPANDEQKITLIKNGYQTQSRIIRLQSAETKQLQVTLKAKLGQLEIRHQSPKASLFINGVRQQRNSGVFKLPASAQRIELKQQGFASYKTRVTPKPGYPQRLDIRLQQAKSEKSASPVVAKSRVQSSDGSWLRLLKPFDFTMGASRREAGRRANERLHGVKMTRAFYLAETEVSNAQFRKFSSQHNSGRVEDKSLNGEANPVVSVSWVQAVQYCNWLSKRDGFKPVYKMSGSKVQSVDLNANGYRLPTEAEWAWAARAGKSRNDALQKFAWGQTLTPPKGAANIADGSAAQLVARIVENYNDGYAVSAPVASFTANQHGLFDMGGNVSEWVHDYYGQSQLSAAASAPDPSGPDSGSYHVVRGSSWRHGSIVELRLSYRDYEQNLRDDLGFRLARTVE
jgi:formylglycine-generating enzyme required for sulfatase activity